MPQDAKAAPIQQLKEMLLLLLLPTPIVCKHVLK
jgi:hypothetical protein